MPLFAIYYIKPTHNFSMKGAHNQYDQRNINSKLLKIFTLFMLVDDASQQKVDELRQGADYKPPFFFLCLSEASMASS